MEINLLNISKNCSYFRKRDFFQFFPEIPLSLSSFIVMGIPLGYSFISYQSFIALVYCTVSRDYFMAVPNTNELQVKRVKEMNYVYSNQSYITLQLDFFTLSVCVPASQAEH